MLLRELLKRECPRDWTPLVPELRETLHRRVEVDACPRCGGIFLDKHEIRALTGSARLDRLLTRYLGLDADSPLVCPHCGGLRDGEDVGNVRVDVCLRCNGVWLDAGELERLRSMDDHHLLDFNPEKMAEYLKAKGIKREERKGALREMFRGLGPR